MIIYTSKPDSSFIINEVKAFHQLGVDLLVVHDAQREIPSEILSLATYIHLPKLSESLNLGYVAKNWSYLLRMLLKTPLKDLTQALKQGDLIVLLVLLQNAKHKADYLKNEHSQLITKHDNLLAFWFFDFTFPIVMKQTGMVKAIFSRAHRGDLYEGGFGVNRLQFRRLALQECNGLFPISEDGKAFVQNRYPIYKDKVETFYLGSFRYFEPKLLPKSSETATIVSCSWINNKKRVHEIPKILTELSIDYRWIHFGSGNEEFESKLHDSIVAQGIQDKVELRGKTSNLEIQRFYSQHHVDCFISVSSTEGVPVSFMEAISYGIPIAATDVGGNHELVNEKTGRLLPLESSNKHFADEIEATIRRFKEENDKVQIRKHWEAQFNILSLAKRLLLRMGVI